MLDMKSSRNFHSYQQNYTRRDRKFKLAFFVNLKGNSIDRVEKLIESIFHPDHFYFIHLEKVF